jgi:hypothetical protein
MKCLVSVGTVDGAQRQSQEIMVSYIGNDVYLSIYGDVGNAQLFNVSTNVTDGVVTLSVTTLSANTKVSAKQLAVI